MSKIVTRTGDDGTTSLGDASRVAKDDTRIAAIGDVDELNSSLGVLLAETLPARVREVLIAVQHDLFDVGAQLCMPGEVMISHEHVARLDGWLEQFNAHLPPLREFVLPGGSRPAALLHLCRTVCRRAERTIVALGQEQAVDAALRQYVNRLSDLMFVLARVLNDATGQLEVLWRHERA